MLKNVCKAKENLSTYRLLMVFFLFLDLSQNERGNKILVIGATNRLNAIDPTLRRADRFDQEICLEYQMCNQEYKFYPTGTLS